MSLRYSIIIPALNEARLIESTLQVTSQVFAAFNEPFEIIVVDDGSSDTTVQGVTRYALHDTRVRLLRHDTNQGKGAAVRTGMLAAHGEWGIFMDADLATHPSAFASFIPHLTQNDIVFGSRRVPGARIVEAQSLVRDWSGQLFNLLVRSIVGLPYRDTQCGFKAFRLAACSPLFTDLQTLGWAFDVELLVRAKKAGLRVRELPVEWRHGPISRVRLGHAGSIMSELMRIRRLARVR